MSPPLSGFQVMSAKIPRWPTSCFPSNTFDLWKMLPKKLSMQGIVRHPKWPLWCTDLTFYGKCSYYCLVLYGSTTWVRWTLNQTFAWKLLWCCAVLLYTIYCLQPLTVHYASKVTKLWSLLLKLSSAALFSATFTTPCYPSSCHTNFKRFHFLTPLPQLPGAFISFVPHRSVAVYFFVSGNYSLHFGPFEWHIQWHCACPLELMGYFHGKSLPM